MRPNFKTYIQKLSPLFQRIPGLFKIIDKLFVSMDPHPLTF